MIARVDAEIEAQFQLLGGAVALFGESMFGRLPHDSVLQPTQ
jgi:hypothetical protein